MTGPKSRILLKAMGITAAFAASFGAFAYASADMLLKIAFDRRLPAILKRNFSKISGTADRRSKESLKKTASKKLKQAEHENVSVVSFDKTKLEGHYFPAENAERLIIAFHGWRSSWNYEFGQFSDFFSRNGCSVLYAEQRGQGNSEGNFMSLGILERYDCRAWAGWAKGRFGSMPVYLFGISMGAAAVLMSADILPFGSVRGIIADSGYASVHGILEHVIKNNLHLSYTLRKDIADRICKRKMNIRLEDGCVKNSLENTEIPILFIHGLDDKFVPVEMTYENYKNCKSLKRLLIIPGAGHAASYSADREKYETAVRVFWKEFDKKETFKSEFEF